MSTQLTEEQKKELESNSEELTQQTRNQEDTRIDDEETPEQVIARLEQRLAQQTITNRRLESTLEKINQRLDESPKELPRKKERNVEEDSKRYYGDPVGVLNETLNEKLDERDSKILDHIDRAIAPIRKIAESFRGNSVYEELKADVFANEPRFKKAYSDPDVKRIVDSIMSQQDAESLTEGTLKTAIASAVGSVSMGITGGNRRVQNRNEDDDDRESRRIDPPNIPPSRSRRGGEMKKEEKPLTEDDKMAMRYASLNPNKPEDVKEYWELMDAPADKVVSKDKKREAK